MNTEAKVKERPILFAGPLVRQILEGEKTQTRRPLKPQPTEKPEGRWSWIASSSERGEAGKFQYSWPDPDGNAFTIRGREQAVRYRCPFGAVGERLWVRETWAIVPKVSDDGPKHKAKGDGTGATWRADWNGNPSGFKWKPSIHMPRWASRITLEITAVRVQKLNDLTNADAVAEGMAKSHPSIDKVSRSFGYEDFSRSMFAQLWDSLYFDCPWESNPWVWVIEFKRIGDL